MANTVADIEKQIAELENQKTALLNQSKIETIDKIKALINEYDLTAKDLGIKPPKKAGSKSKPVYANPHDTTQTWTGRGRQPNWVASYLSLGHTLESALIKE